MPNPVQSASRLLLVATAGAATTSALELASLGADIGAGVRVGHTGSLAEVLACGAGGTPALQQQGVLAGGRLESQLVEGQNLAASLQDALPGGLGDVQGAHRELGHDQQAGIIGDGADDHDGRLRLVGGLEEASDALQR